MVDSAAAFFQLPEGRFGLEPVHQEPAGFKGGFTMRGTADDQDNVFTWQHASNAMNNETCIERPAGECFLLDFRKRFLGHARIMFQSHVPKQASPLFTSRTVPTKMAMPPMLWFAGLQLCKLMANVKCLLFERGS